MNDKEKNFDLVEKPNAGGTVGLKSVNSRVTNLNILICCMFALTIAIAVCAFGFAAHSYHEMKDIKDRLELVTKADVNIAYSNGENVLDISYNGNNFNIEEYVNKRLEDFKRVFRNDFISLETYTNRSFSQILNIETVLNRRYTDLETKLNTRFLSSVTNVQEEFQSLKTALTGKDAELEAQTKLLMETQNKQLEALENRLSSEQVALKEKILGTVDTTVKVAQTNILSETEKIVVDLNDKYNGQTANLIQNTQAKVNTLEAAIPERVSTELSNYRERKVNLPQSNARVFSFKNEANSNSQLNVEISGSGDQVVSLNTFSESVGYDPALVLNRKLTVLSTGEVGVNTVPEVGRALKVGGDVAVQSLNGDFVKLSGATIPNCNTGNAGSILYNPSSSSLDFCNGVKYQSALTLDTAAFRKAADNSIASTNSEVQDKKLYITADGNVGVQGMAAAGIALNVKGDANIVGKVTAFNIYLGDKLKDCAKDEDKASISWDNARSRLTYCAAGRISHSVANLKDLEPLALREEIGFKIDPLTRNLISTNTQIESKQIKISPEGHIGVKKNPDADFFLDVNGPTNVNGQLRLKELKFEDQTAVLTCSSLMDNGRASYDPTGRRINYCHDFSSTTSTPLQKLAHFEEIGFLIDRNSKLISSTNSATDAQRIFIDANGNLAIRKTVVTGAGIPALDVNGDTKIRTNLVVDIDGQVGRDFSAGRHIYSTGNVNSATDVLASRDIIAGRDISAVRNIASGAVLSAVSDISGGRDITSTRDIISGNDVTVARDVLVTGKVDLGELFFKDKSGSFSCSSAADQGRANFDKNAGRIKFCQSTSGTTTTQDLSYYSEVGFIKTSTNSLISANSASSSNQIIISANGDLGIKKTATNGVSLDVSGMAKISGNLETSSKVGINTAVDSLASVFLKVNGDVAADRLKLTVSTDLDCANGINFGLVTVSSVNRVQYCEGSTKKTIANLEELAFIKESNGAIRTTDSASAPSILVTGGKVGIGLAASTTPTSVLTVNGEMYSNTIKLNRLSVAFTCTATSHNIAVSTNPDGVERIRYCEGTTTKTVANTDQIHLEDPDNNGVWTAKSGQTTQLNRLGVNSPPDSTASIISSGLNIFERMLTSSLRFIEQTYTCDSTNNGQVFYNPSNGKLNLCTGDVLRIISLEP